MNRFIKTIITLTALSGFLTLSGCLTQSDGAATVSVPTPVVPVTNSAPTISGNPPPAVTVGELYSFVPVASDPDGDTLQFSIQNTPSWASFNDTTGEISGTPTLGNVGISAGISISVSDGQASASTPLFSVEVSQTQLASVTLSWAAPIENSDGSQLTDLSGYKILYGNTLGNYPNQIRIDNPSITTYVVENLAPNNYFFVATAFNSQGAESTFSSPTEFLVN